MYLKDIGVGSIENKHNFNVIQYDFDTYPLWQNTDTPLSVTTYDGYDTEENEIEDLGLRLHLDNSTWAPTSSVRKHNDGIVDRLKFGMFDSEADCIIPFNIQYDNNNTGVWNNSVTNVEYTEVEVTNEPPENWDSEKTYCYYIKGTWGTGQTALDVYEQIPVAYYDWEALKADFDQAEDPHLYYNNQLSKRILIGTEEKGISFSIGKSESTIVSGAGDRQNPGLDVFVRNSPGGSANYAYNTGGYIKRGFDPVTETHPLWKTGNSNPFLTGDTNQFYCFEPDTTTCFGTAGRLSLDAPATKQNKINECTLLQFGQVTYNGKVYTGVFRVYYYSCYYWGYYSNIIGVGQDLNPYSWATLSDSPVTYDATMNKGKNIRKITFSGICLDDIGVEVTVDEGEAPIDPPDDGGGNYPKGRGTFLSTSAFGTLATPDDSGFHIYYLTGSDFKYLIDGLSRSGASGFLWHGQDIMNAILNRDPEDPNDALEDYLKEYPWSGPMYSVAQAISANSAKEDAPNSIVFCRKMPTFVSSAKIASNKTLVVGSGQLIFQSITPSYFQDERISCTQTFTFQVDWQTSTFLDLAPYVDCRVFLPYVGDVQIPINSFIGGGEAKLEVHYDADITTGRGAATIRTISYDGYEAWFGPYMCDLSVSVPLSIIDSRSFERASAITKAAVSTIAGVASGNVGEVLSGVEQFGEGIRIPPKTTPISVLGDGNGYITPNAIRVQMTFPKPNTKQEKNINNIIDRIGCTSSMTGKVKDFLSEKITKYSYVNTDGIAKATEAEKREIERLMKEGVY